jgi:hypothetical protein
VPRPDRGAAPPSSVPPRAGGTRNAPGNPPPHARVVPGRPVTPPANPAPAPSPPVRPAPAPAATRAPLIVRSHPAGVRVLVDGRPRGATDDNGFLNLEDLTPGAHIVTLQHDNHQPQDHRVGLYPGRNNILEVTLVPMPGQLDVEVSVPGARISIPYVGNFMERVQRAPVRPGKYQAFVAKPGFRTETIPFEIHPGQPERLVVKLEPLTAVTPQPITAPARPPVSPEQTLAGLEQAYQRRQYDVVIRGAGEQLAAQPSNARLNYMMGSSYLGKRDYPASVEYLARAVANGETVRFTIKHHHRSGLNDDLCTGILQFSRGTVGFQSTNRGGHDFTVPMTGVAAAKWEPQKESRINLDVVVGGERRTYNFHPAAAQLARSNPRDPRSQVVVLCRGCEPEMNAIYQLLVRLKQ